VSRLGRGNFHWHGAFGVGCGKFKIAECVFPLGSSSVAILNFPHPTPLPAEFAAPPGFSRLDWRGIADPSEIVLPQGGHDGFANSGVFCDTPALKTEHVGWALPTRIGKGRRSQFRTSRPIGGGHSPPYYFADPKAKPIPAW